MEIIAKTRNGVLIDATTDEVKEIINAVAGDKPSELSVGMKIPAIDYASTIKKVKSLEKEYSFRQLVSYAEDFSGIIDGLRTVVSEASDIEL